MQKWMDTPMLEMSGQLHDLAALTPFSFSSLHNNKSPHLIDAIPTLSWWWGLGAPETLRAIPAVA
jgi:hypothetical protein